MKLNNVRADTNPASNSISNDKLKKVQDELEDVVNRVG